MSLLRNIFGSFSGTLGGRWGFVASRFRRALSLTPADHEFPFRATSVKYSKKTNSLHVTFDDGVQFDFHPEYLRVFSPAESRDKVVSQRADVGIMGIEPVGQYGVRIMFDDMHSSGIYSWEYLYDLGRREDENMKVYLNELEKKGLSRHRKPRDSSV